MEFVEADGVEIAYERVGEGSPLVFVHGAAEDSRTWQPQLVGLADESPSWRGRSLVPAGPPTCPRASA